MRSALQKAGIATQDNEEAKAEIEQQAATDLQQAAKDFAATAANGGA